MIRKAFVSLAAFFCMSAAFAAESPLWMRNSMISPDGKEVCFTYKGDIYVVSSQGGRARQLTTNQAYDTRPMWTPDGKSILFSSDRAGSQDLYVVPAEGGSPVRITTHSGNEIPEGFLNDSTVIFSASVMPSREDIQFPSGTFRQMYTVSLNGGRPKMLTPVTMESVSVSENGTLLYQDVKGYEDKWRKHHTSSITRDIWMCSAAGDGKLSGFSKITSFNGEDRNPVWNEEGRSFYYLSEEDGNSNIYLYDIRDNSRTQVSFFRTNPVRFLSKAQDGTLCFGYDGEIYTGKMENGKFESSKLNVEIIRDYQQEEMFKVSFRSGASEFTVSPDGEEIVFVYKGDVFVASVKYGTTKRITNTPEQEKNVSFSPDGRSVVYASERDGVWQIYQSSIVRDTDSKFCYAAEIEEKKLVDTGITSFDPKYSPDGNSVAFIEERTGIKAIDVKSGKIRTIKDKKYEYSYMDGDQWYSWSPDSRWIITGYIGDGGWNNKDIAVYNADGKGEMYNLTQSGYTDANGMWVLGGKAMMWLSDRAGYRSHGSWGAEADAYIMFFDVEAFDRFMMSEEERALYDAAKQEKKEKDSKKDRKSGKSGKSDKKDDGKEKEVFEPDFRNAEFRTLRLTRTSGNFAGMYLTPDGSSLYYIVEVEGSYDLWVMDIEDRSVRQIMRGIGPSSIESDATGSNIFVFSNGMIQKIDLASGAMTPVMYEGVFEYNPGKEREFMFSHVWKQVSDKFYVEDLHGVDWNMYRDIYARQLPHISNNEDFAELLSEFLGELNASHTGARYRKPSGAIPVANLGVFYDETYEGDGLKIAEIIRQSPLDMMRTDVKAGCIIEAIDGEKILAGQDYFPLLEGKVGERVRLTVYDPEKKSRFEQEVNAIGAGELNELLYRRWVDRNAEKVAELSDGKIAYIHIKGMDSPSFRSMYSRLLGKYRNCEAVVVDTRHNGGGWLHDDVVTLLGGKQYQKFVAHGQFIGNDPFNKWCKPSCMLICEDNYSNAHGTPWVYKTLGIGKLVGAPVPGTMTAVWWENLVNPYLVYGIPQVGCVDMQGNYAENKTLEPDIEIYNTPEDVISGHDRQLEAAVEEMLRETGNAE